MKWSVLVVLTGLPVAAAGGDDLPPADLYVAPIGSDADAGTVARPLRTLAAARDRIRPRLKAMRRDLVVMLRGGDYYLDKTFSLGPADSGRNGFRVIYRNWPQETPRLIGGRRITGWRRHEGAIWRAEVPKGWTFQQLFVDRVRRIKARHPNGGYLLAAGSVREDRLRQFRYRPGDVRQWAVGPEAQVYLWAGEDHLASLLPLKAIDAAQSIVHLGRPTPVPIVKKPQRRYFIQGVRGALDRPGEWFLDEPKGELLLWPLRSKVAELTIVAPHLTRVVEIKGDDADTPAAGIRLEGLSIAVSRFGRYFVETSGTHGQTPPNEPANKEAALYVENAQRCQIADCHVANAGYNGITLNGHVQQVEVTGNLIRECGFHGVLLSGYRSAFGRGMDRNRDNAIVDNYIHHCGRLVGHGGGIFVWASGRNVIAHNLIHDMPRYGICMKGETWGGRYPQAIGRERVTAETRGDFVHSRNNRITFNHIHSVNQDSEAGGFISAWATGRGNVIHNNLLHHCRRNIGGLSMGIYLEEGSDDFTVTSNVIYDIKGGNPGRCFCIFAKGTRNVIENNVLIGDDHTGAAIASMHTLAEPAEHHTYRRNIIYLTMPSSAAYAFLTWTDDRVASSDHNCFHSTLGRPVMRRGSAQVTLPDWRALPAGRFDRHSIIDDPKFIAPSAHDYRLRADSPARKLGIRSVDVSQCGLLPDNRYAPGSVHAPRRSLGWGD